MAAAATRARYSPRGPAAPQPAGIRTPREVHEARIPVQDRGGGGVLLPLQEVSQPQCVQLRKASEAREVRQSEAAVERDRVQRGARGQGVHVAQGVAAGQREHLQAAAP
jgi:hypothetical protein